MLVPVPSRLVGSSRSHVPAFVNTILDGAPVQFPTFADGLRTQEVLEAAELSHTDGSVDFSAFASVSADGMASADFRLAAYFELSKLATAAAGRALMAFVLELDVQIAWKLNKTPVEFPRLAVLLRSPVGQATQYILDIQQWRLRSSGRTPAGQGTGILHKAEVTRRRRRDANGFVGQAHRTESLLPPYCPRPLM